MKGEGRTPGGQEDAMGGNGIGKRIGRTALALGAGVTVLGAAAPGPSPSGVTVRLFQFTPGQIEVPAGTTVTWTNQDDIAHTVTSGTPERREDRFDAALAGKGATVSVELREPGVYPYFCNRHQSMRGEIRVK
jgi:plastocyanin